MSLPRSRADSDRDLSTSLRAGRDGDSVCGDDGVDLAGASKNAGSSAALRCAQRDKPYFARHGKSSLGGRAVRGALAVYKYTLSPFLHAFSGPAAGCRFQPTCSEYAALAWHVHGPVRGSWLATLRLLRCHPFARGGFDPVPGTRTPSTEKTPAI